MQIEPYNLSEFGIPEVPVFGFSRYPTTLPTAKPHRHLGVVEISCCVRGAENFECDGVTQSFLPGTITLAFPKNRHRFSARAKNTSKFWMFLSLGSAKADTWLGLSKEESKRLQNAIKEAAPVLHDSTGEVRRLFSESLKVVESKPLHPTLARIRLRNLIINMIFAILSADSRETATSEPDKVNTLITTMRAHPEKEYPLNSLISQAAMSPSKLLRVFKSLTGYPPHAYLITCRIAKAKEMLLQGKPNAVIARSLGFASPRHFVSQFKAHTGLPPQSFIQNLRHVSSP